MTASSSEQGSERSPFDYELTWINPPHPSLSELRGRVLLIVNTASKCGFTPQYDALTTLHERYHERGLSVIGCPCDQFGHQEPGSAEEIEQFCRVSFNVSFPLSEKLCVNGPHTHPLFEHLKKEAPGLLGKSIRWNFTKFLVGRDGRVISRYAPLTSPLKLEGDIIKALNN